jgi:chromosome segregation ATPase
MDGGGKSEPASPSLPHETVQALARMIRELETQLDRMFEINGSLERELETERTRRREGERKADDLAEQLRRSEESALEREGLAAENAELRQERGRLVRTADEQRRALAEAEAERKDHAATVDRLRAGRTDALEELHIVEAQFERAMEMVADVKARLAILNEEHQALLGRLKLAESKAAQALGERDQLMAEVEESRSALEDIRRSLVDACVASQSRWKEDSPG